MRDSIKFYYLLFLLSPFLAFILAIRRGFDKRYQGIILAFSFFYGYGVYLYSGDILGYQKAFDDVLQYSWYDFWYILSNILDPNALNAYAPNSVNRKPDIFALVLMFFSSRLSDSPRFFWGLVSLFYTWMMLLFFNESKRHFRLHSGSFVHFVLVFFLIIVIPKYVGVTGVRFWPALFLFVYNTLRYIRNRYALRYLLSLALSVLIHYTFLLPMLLLVVFHFVPVKVVFARVIVLVCFLLFILSSTTGVFNLLQKVISFSDETTIGQSAEGYTDQDMYEQRAMRTKSVNWYVQIRASAHYYLFLIIYFLDIFGLLNLKETDFTKMMFPILVIFFCLTLLTINLGSIGRFKNIFILLIILRYVVLVPLNKSLRFTRVLGFVLTPVVAFYFVVIMRSELYFVEAYLPIQNSVSFFVFRAEESLSEFIVGH